MKHMRKLLLTLLVGVMTLGSALTVNATEENPFADIKETDWYYPYVTYALENNFMGGKEKDENGLIVFDPLSNITRAEFVQSLYSKEGKPPVEIINAFSDVKSDDWYAAAVSWAAEKGLVAGKGSYFDVNAPITREEVATILYQYAKNQKGYSVVGSTELTSFADAGKVSNWATNYMRWAIHYGVMAGKGKNLAPLASASRAECATMLKAFVDAYTLEYVPGGLHDYEWIVTEEPSDTLATCEADFGSRTYVCSECGAKRIKEVMVNIGDRIVCGTFDEEDKDLFLAMSNIERRISTTVETDDWGNALEIVCPTPLKEVAELSVIAKIRAAEAAIEFNHDKMRTAAENLEWGSSNAMEAHTAWVNSTGHLRSMIDPEWTETGGACFWYDGEDNGKNLVPIRVQVFEGAGFLPIEPDEASKEIIHNDETGIPDVAFYQKAVSMHDRNGDGLLSYGEAARPGSLRFSESGIIDIRGIEYFTGATKIDFSGNHISDLTPMENLTDVYWNIDLSDNQITDLTPLTNLNVLELYLRNNQIRDITPLHRTYTGKLEDYDKIAYFGELDLTGNMVTDLTPLAGMIVQHLYLGDNGLDNKDILALADMKLTSNYGLDLSYNNISDISFLGDFGTDRNPFTEVDYINLSHNQLAELNTTLKAISIDLSYNQLTNIANVNTGRLAAIGKLDISHNQISDLTPIGNHYGPLNHLEYLDASYNNIRDVKSLNDMVFYELNLSHNQISDISPLATMTMQATYNVIDYRNFDITYNNITDLSPWKDSALINSIVTRIEKMPENALVGDLEGNIEQKAIRIAEGNRITLANAQANLAGGLLNSKLYSYHTVSNIGESRPTAITWIETENFLGTTINTSKNGLVLEDGILKYYKDGLIDYLFVGIASYEGKLYYVDRGFVDTGMNGLYYVREDGTKHFATKDKLGLDRDSTITDIYKIKAGAVDTEYSGAVSISFVYYSGGMDNNDFYYLTKGIYDTEYTGIGLYWQNWYGTDRYIPRHFVNGRFDRSFRGTVAIGDNCWILEEGMLEEDFTGLIANETGVSRYYNEGVFDATYCGVAEHYEDGNVYYVTNGLVDTTYNGFAKADGTVYYFENGKVDYDYVGIWKDPEDGNTYYIKGGTISRDNGYITIDGALMYFNWGVLDTSKDGIIKNPYTGIYYMFDKGIQDVDYNDFAVCVENGWEYYYYFENGVRMEDDYCGFREGTINGVFGEWFVWYGTCNVKFRGVLITEDGTEDYHGIYIENGQANASYTGLCTGWPDSTKYYYVTDGRLDTEFTDTVLGQIDGKYYWFNVVNGVVSSYWKSDYIPSEN